MHEGKPLVISYGAGVNSTALLVGLQERGIIPDLILFADTGAEEPHTYNHVKIVSAWCVDHGMPPITTVYPTNKHGEVITLVGDCQKRGALPGLAYGFKSCTERFKIRPQRKYIKSTEMAQKAWADGSYVLNAIGLDYGEDTRTRLTFSDDMKYEYWYPFDEWRWDRKKCVDVICKAGLPQPGKSACYICPSTRVIEILRLAVDYPEKLGIALDIERNADLLTVKGLGRNFAWADLFVDGDPKKGPKQIEMFGLGISDWQIPCDCWDGG